MGLTFLEQDHKTCTDPLFSLQVFPCVSLRHLIYHCEEKKKKHVLSYLDEIQHKQNPEDQEQQKTTENEIPSCHISFRTLLSSFHYLERVNAKAYQIWCWVSDFCATSMKVEKVTVDLWYSNMTTFLLQFSYFPSYSEPFEKHQWV